MIRRTRCMAVVATMAALCCFPALGAPPGEPTSVKVMLQAFVDDFRKDPTADQPITFGIRIGQAELPQWHVVVAGREEGQAEAAVELREGPPPQPRAFFVTDRETLERIYRGEMASLTAMGKADSSDFAPLDMEVMEGFQPTPEVIPHLIRLSFHFWTRGFPEIVRFGDKGTSRELHGANAVLFYYQKGFRSGWFRVLPGQHANKDPKMQTNPFPSIIVVTRGSVQTKIGGVEQTLVEGEMVFIGAGVTHEFWNDGDRPGEGILLMFGEGA